MMTLQRPPTARGRFLWAWIGSVILLGVGAVIIWGFLQGRIEAAREAERERPVAAPLRVSIVNGEQVITMDAETLKRSGIETGIPAPAPYQAKVRAYGTVIDLARLTELSNISLNGKAQLQAAQAKLTASKAAFERAQKLNRDQQNVSAAQLQAAEATFRGDQATLAAADAQLRTLAATALQEMGPVLGKSLLDGSGPATRLIDRQDFLLQITLPPGIAIAQPPPTAFVQIGNGSQVEIRFVSPATRTDPKIQGVSFFYVAAGDSGVLPGMNVLSFLPTGDPIAGAAIPSGAIVWWQDRAWVYRRAGPMTFTRAEIATSLPARDGGAIVKGAPAGEIVTRGAQMLLSEEFRAQIQVGVDQK